MASPSRTGRPRGQRLSKAEDAAIAAALADDPHASLATLAAKTGFGPGSIARVRRRVIGPSAVLVRRREVEVWIKELERLGGDVDLARRALKLDQVEAEARQRQAAILGLVPLDLPTPARPVEGFEIASHAVTLDGSGQVKARSIRHRRAAADRFETPAGHQVKGVSALTDADGRVLAQWVKTRESAVDPEHVRAALTEALAAFKGCAGAAEGPARLETAPDLLTQYTVPDLHMGLLAWGKETGQPYDVAIARRMVHDTVCNLVDRAEPSDEAILLFLGDTLHQNDRTNMTPRSGHVLDVDGRFFKVLRTMAETAIALADKARRKHRRVTVRFVPGNHDPEVAISLTLALFFAFQDDPRVIIDQSPGGHFYHRFGAVLIGATHGHTMPPDRMAMMLAVDRAEDWGQTRHRHFFFGHVHRESAKEIAGVRVESFNSPAARDAYAYDGGFRSGRALVAITYHRERGEIARHRVNIG